MTNLTQQFTVSEQDTALVVGSGSLEVLATPRMIAWMENTAMKLCSHLCGEGETTVGIAIDAQHTKASGVGTVVTISASIDGTEGRKAVLSITATDDKGNTIGCARHERFVVDAARFMSKIQAVAQK